NADSRWCRQASDLRQQLEAETRIHDVQDLDPARVYERQDEPGGLVAGHQIREVPDFVGVRGHLVEPPVERRLRGDQAWSEAIAVEESKPIDRPLVRASN